MEELVVAIRPVFDGPLMYILGDAKISDLQQMWKWMSEEDIAFYNSIGVPSPRV